MIVSVHMPKTAGASFLNALRDVYGGALLADYDDMASLQRYFAGEAPERLCTPRPAESLEGIACVHGHFLAKKYEVFAADPRNRFVTWLREPLQRLCSHYYFWRRAYDPAIAGPLFRKVVEEDWSLERFCLCEEYRNVYTKYLYRFPVERFDFIGIVEHYEEDLSYLGARILGVELLTHQANRNSESSGQYSVDDGLRAEVQAHHAADYALYRSALAARKGRIPGAAV